MDKKANLFLCELYQRMPISESHPYFNLSPDQLYQRYRFLFEFYEDNYGDILPQKKDMRILDIGFGFGMFMAYAKRNGFSNIWGVEYNKAQVDNAAKMGFRAELISDLSAYLKNNLSGFDLIHASNVVEHFPKYDLIEIFDLFYNALKDNGRLAVIVPNIAGWRSIYKRYLVLGHESGFSETSIRQLFQITHFDNIKVFGSRIRFRFRIKHIFMRIAQGIFDIIIGIIDYVYLGVNRPRHLGQCLVGIGVKAGRGCGGICFARNKK